MEDNQQTFADFVIKHGVRMVAEYKGVESKSAVGEAWDCFAWSCTLRYGAQKYTTAYRMGLAHCKRAPTFGSKVREKVTPEIAKALAPNARVTISDIEGYVEPTKPTVETVLQSLASDAQSALDARDFEEFASNFGYDPDSRSAERVYNGCKAAHFELSRLFGAEACAELLACVEEGS